MVNIKLDKTGGLTEALALREAAREAEGFGDHGGLHGWQRLWPWRLRCFLRRALRWWTWMGRLLLAEDRPVPPWQYDTAWRASARSGAVGVRLAHPVDKIAPRKPGSDPEDV